MREIKRKLTLMMAVIAILLQGSYAYAKKTRYVDVNLVSGISPEISLQINKKSLFLDLSRTRNIRIRLKAKPLFNDIERISSFNIILYEIVEGQRVFLSSQNVTHGTGSRSSRVISIDAGYFSNPSKQVELDIYDTANNLINTYSAEISAFNIESQVTSDNIVTAAANCDSGSFDECQIDYLFSRIRFEAKPQRQMSTRIVKGNDGLYKVTLPVPRTRFKFLGKKVRRKEKSDSLGSGGAGTSDFGETINTGKINIGNSLSDSMSISYGDGTLNFNNSIYLDLNGRLGIGVEDPQAWLHITNGDSQTPSIILEQGELTTTPIDGAIEFDGEKLYFTKEGVRTELGAQGPQGPTGSTGPTGPQGIPGVGSNGTIENESFTIINGDVTYTNGTVVTINKGTIFNYDNGIVNYDNGTIINFTNGSMLQDAFLNGNTIIDNGTLTITTSTPTAGYILTTDANGLATWQANSGPSSNGTTIINNGDISYINGTTLFSNGIVNFNGTTINETNVTRNIENGSYNFSNSNITLNGTIISFTNGSYLQDAFLNGNTIIDNGTLTITTSTPTAGYILTTDANGFATWQASPGPTSNGTTIINNGDISYINGTTLFSNGIVNINGTTINETNVTRNIENGTYDFSNSNITLNGTTISFTNGSYLQDAFLNGNTIIDNGSLVIATGSPVAGYVLTTDGNGLTSWASAAALSGNGDDLGNHTATTNLNMSSRSITNADNGTFVNLTASSTINGSVFNGSVFNGGTFNGIFVGNGAGLTNVLTSGGSISNVTIDNGTFTNGEINSATINGVISFGALGILQDAFLNGNTIIDNGTLTITTSTPTTGYVLVTDNNGLATWTNPSTIASNGDNLGNHTATTNLDLSTNSIINGANGTFVNLTASSTINGYLFNGTTFNGNVFNVNSELNALSGSTVVINGDLEIADTVILLDGSSTTFTQTTGDIEFSPASTANYIVTVSGGGDFNVNNGGLIFNGSTTNVGIGIENPIAKLHVNGDLLVTNGSNLGQGVIMNTPQLTQGTYLGLPSCDSSIKGSITYVDNGTEGMFLGCRRVSGASYDWSRLDLF